MSYNTKLSNWKWN